MNFWTFCFLSLTVILVFIVVIVSMVTAHVERLEKIKRGYPLEEVPDTDDMEVIDCRGNGTR